MPSRLSGQEERAGELHVSARKSYFFGMYGRLRERAGTAAVDQAGDRRDGKLSDPHPHLDPPIPRQPEDQAFGLEKQREPTIQRSVNEHQRTEPDTLIGNGC